MNLSRRGLFSIFARPLKAKPPVSEPMAEPVPLESASGAEPSQSIRVAAVQARHCSALIDYCSLCVDRCPESGAMLVVEGLPMVVPEACTGCGICWEVCPTTPNAILMSRRRAAL